MITDQLASERARSDIRAADQRRDVHRLRTLRRARRIEHRAERRMIAAWDRAAKLRRAVGSAEY